jgi:hypothetical protein
LQRFTQFYDAAVLAFSTKRAVKGIFRIMTAVSGHRYSAPGLNQYLLLGDSNRGGRGCLKSFGGSIPAGEPRGPLSDPQPHQASAPSLAGWALTVAMHNRSTHSTVTAARNRAIMGRLAARGDIRASRWRASPGALR